MRRTAASSSWAQGRLVTSTILPPLALVRHTGRGDTGRHPSSRPARLPSRPPLRHVIVAARAGGGRADQRLGRPWLPDQQRPRLPAHPRHRRLSFDRCGPGALRRRARTRSRKTRTDVAPSRRAIVIQEPRLLPWRRAEANVRLGLRVPDAAARANTPLEEVGLAHRNSAWPAGRWQSPEGAQVGGRL